MEYPWVPGLFDLTLAALDWDKQTPATGSQQVEETQDYKGLLREASIWTKRQNVSPIAPDDTTLRPSRVAIGEEPGSP